PAAPPTGPFAWYHRTPLYLRIVVALVLGILVGELFGPKGDIASRYNADFLQHIVPISTKVLTFFKTFSTVVLRVLGALATPLIFVAVAQAILKAKVGGKMAGKLLSLLFLNTMVAILVGLLVANVVQPGHHYHQT